MEKANYGIDAPAFLIKYSMIGFCALAATIAINFFLKDGWISTLAMTLSIGATISCLWPVVTIFLGSVKFKFRDRDWLFENLALQGHENILDVGCGHGLLLIAAAKKLTSGRAVGLDKWAQEDQAANSKNATLKNAEIEGVASQIEIQTGDMTKMPFEDHQFDAIVSSWAIHNIYNKDQRRKALAEMMRVLKPGGKIAILDIDFAPEYFDYFKAQGLGEVQLLGPNYTFGNKTYLVLARNL